MCAPCFLAVEQRRTAVIADLLLLGTAHIGVQLRVARTANLLQLLPKINRSRWSWRWLVATLVRTWILDPAPCTRPGRWRRKLGRSGWILLLLPGSRAEAELLPAGVQQGRGRQAHGTLRVLPQNLLVCFTLVDFQAIRSFETRIALFARKCFTLVLVGFQASYHSRLLGKEIFSAFSISLQGRWVFLLLDLHGQGCLALLGVQGEGEGGANGDGQLEVLASIPPPFPYIKSLRKIRSTWNLKQSVFFPVARG